MTKRLVVMISGGGTNLQALIDAIADNTLSAEIVGVISNKQSAYGLVRAEKAGIPTLHFSMKPYRSAGKSREDYDADLAQRVAEFSPDLIVLAGWMRILTPNFLDQFPKQVINLHPALSGEFAGINAIERAYEAWQAGEIAHSGCMVHYVIPEVDAGEVIVQEIVPFEAGDTLETFEARIHQAEHRIIVKATSIALDRL